MSIEPFTIAIPQADIDDLHLRLSLTRWPDEVAGSEWRYGSNLNYMKDLMSYWQNTFDWRGQEQQLNTFDHFRTTMNGMKIHFVHARGKGPQPFPLILSHGWPSSFVEMLKLVPRLTNPARYGGDPALEEPDLLAEDLRAFFRPLRTSGA